VNVPCCLIR